MTKLGKKQKRKKNLRLVMMMIMMMMKILKVIIFSKCRSVKWLKKKVLQMNIRHYLKQKNFKNLLKC
jgi:hypothetical protein